MEGENEMKTMAISKRRVWQRCCAELEVWECVPLGNKGKADAKPLAYVAEHVRQAGGKSFFTYEVGEKGGWECRRREAMKRAEAILDGKDATLA